MKSRSPADTLQRVPVAGYSALIQVFELQRLAILARNVAPVVLLLGVLGRSFPRFRIQPLPLEFQIIRVTWLHIYGEDCDAVQRGFVLHTDGEIHCNQGRRRLRLLGRRLGRAAAPVPGQAPQRVPPMGLPMAFRVPPPGLPRVPSPAFPRVPPPVFLWIPPLGPGVGRLRHPRTRALEASSPAGSHTEGPKAIS